MKRVRGTSWAKGWLGRPTPPPALWRRRGPASSASSAFGSGSGSGSTSSSASTLVRASSSSRCLAFRRRFPFCCGLAFVSSAGVGPDAAVVFVFVGFVGFFVFARSADIVVPAGASTGASAAAALAFLGRPAFRFGGSASCGSGTGGGLAAFVVFAVFVGFAAFALKFLVPFEDCCSGCALSPPVCRQLLSSSEFRLRLLLRVSASTSVALRARLLGRPVSASAFTLRLRFPVGAVFCDASTTAAPWSLPKDVFILA